MLTPASLDGVPAPVSPPFSITLANVEDLSSINLEILLFAPELTASQVLVTQPDLSTFVFGTSLIPD